MRRRWGAFRSTLRRIQRLLELPQVEVLDAAHEREHSLEVHLPFLQETLGEFTLVPLAVGNATASEVAEVIEQLWDDETLFVISSDLSHFHDYDTGRRLDRATCRAIEDLRLEDLRGDRACGFKPIGGMLAVARDKGLTVRLLDLRSSGDTGGDRDRVVGYGAFIVEQSPRADFDELSRVARVGSRRAQPAGFVTKVRLPLPTRERYSTSRRSRSPRGSSPDVPWSWTSINIRRHCASRGRRL